MSDEGAGLDLGKQNEPDSHMTWEDVAIDYIFSECRLVLCISERLSLLSSCMDKTAAKSANRCCGAAALLVLLKWVDK